MNMQDFIDYAKQHGLNNKEMSEKIGMPYVTYYKYIRGGTKTPSEVTADKLKDFYDRYIKRDQIIEDIFTYEPIKPIIKPKTEKVYIESIEDMIAELKSGNTIYIDDTNKTIQLVDGFIVRYDGFMQVSINEAILCSEKHYVIKEIPLKLEVGKKYIAKDGRIATIFAKTQTDRFLATFEGDTNVRSYNSNGNDVGSDWDILVKEY